MTMPSTMFSLTLLICAMAGLSRANFRVHQQPSSRDVLIDTLMAQYQVRRSKDIIPGPVTLTVDMAPMRIDSLKKRVLTMVAYVYVHWNDPRLAWDNNNCTDPIEDIQLPLDKIWTPDLEFYSADAVPETLLQNHMASVFSSGNVSVAWNYKLRVFCQNYTEDASGNNVTCNFKIGSWSTDKSLIDLSSLREDLDTFSFVVMDWNIGSSNVTRNEVVYPCCPGVAFVDLMYLLHLTNTGG